MNISLFDNISSFDNISPDIFLEEFNSDLPIFTSDLNSNLEQISNPFDFTSLLSELSEEALDPLYHDPDYLDRYLLDQHINRVKNWIKMNPHHTFPKTKDAWLNVLYMHFRKMYIHMNLDKIVKLVESEKDTKSPRISDLVDKINRLMGKNRFADVRDIRIRNLLLPHCNIASNASPEKLYDRMVELNIIPSEKKRKDYSQEVLDLTKSMKRIRVK